MEILSLADSLKYVKNIAINLNDKVVLIGVAGGSASGKTYLAKKLCDELKGSCLSMDDYYFGRENVKDDNFDKPEAFDFGLFRSHLLLLKQGKVIQKPVYDFKGVRTGYVDYKPSKYIIVEGLFALNSLIRDLLSLKIFVDSDSKLRLKRRIERDVKERGKTEERVILRWNRYVEPMFKEYVEPQKKYADVVVLN